MNLFVHVQADAAADAASLEAFWGSQPEAVSKGPSGLFVLMFDPFNAKAPDAAVKAQLDSVLAALKTTFKTAEVAELAEWEYELASGDSIVNVMLRQQGLVLTAQDGVVAVHPWPSTLNAQSIVSCVERAAQTLASAAKAVSAAKA